MSGFTVKGKPMNTFQANFSHARAALPSTSDAAGDARQAAARSAYNALLTAPMSSLASNAADRADVSFAAILGYN